MPRRDLEAKAYLGPDEAAESLGPSLRTVMRRIKDGTVGSGLPRQPGLGTGLMRTGNGLAPRIVPNSICRKEGQRTMRRLMTPTTTILVVALLSSAPCFADEFDDLPEVRALRKGMPEDVVSFISRAAECNHWGGEDPYNEERAAFISKAVEKAGCSRLDGDAEYLLQKYKRDPKVLETIENTEDLFM